MSKRKVGSILGHDIIVDDTLSGYKFYFEVPMTDIRDSIAKMFPNASEEFIKLNEVTSYEEKREPVEFNEIRTFKERAWKAQVKRVDMEAFGKARPRVTRRGTFMPKSYESKRRQLRLLFGPVEVDGPVELSVLVIRKMPDSWSKAEKESKMGTYTTTTPDIDNILGAIMDALFENDQRVVAIGRSAKIWGESHQMVINIEAVEGVVDYEW